VQAQAAQVVAHASGGDVGLGESEQLRKQWPQLLITKALGLEAEQDGCREQGLHPRLAKRQGGGMLAVDRGRLLELIKRLGADVAVVGELFDLQHAAVGGEANLAQGRQVFEASAHPEVVGVVDRGFGPQRPAFLVVLFEVGVLATNELSMPMTEKLTALELGGESSQQWPGAVGWQGGCEKRFETTTCGYI